MKESVSGLILQDEQKSSTGRTPVLLFVGMLAGDFLAEVENSL